MYYKLKYIYVSNELVPVITRYPEYYAPVWGIVEKQSKHKINVKKYKICKFKGVFGTYKQKIIPDTTEHFNTLEEAIMYVSMME